MRCKGIQHDGKRCKKDAVLKGYCLVHLYQKPEKKYKRKYPPGCGICKYRKECEYLKKNNWIDCSLRRRDKDE